MLTCYCLTFMCCQPFLPIFQCYQNFVSWTPFSIFSCYVSLQSCRSLRSVGLSFGGRILGLIKVLITVGWKWWRHQRGPLFSLASAPPNLKPTIMWAFPPTQIIFGMTSNKRSSCDSSHVGRQYTKFKQRWAPFLVVFSGSLSRISGILQTFSGILPRFSTNQSFWGCAYTPFTPASYTSAKNQNF